MNIVLKKKKSNRHSDTDIHYVIGVSLITLFFFSALYLSFNYEPPESKLIKAITGTGTQEAPKAPLETAVPLPEKKNLKPKINKKSKSSAILLNDSDSYAKYVLHNISNGMNILPYFNENNLIRRFVSFVDSLANNTLATSTNPTKLSMAKFNIKSMNNQLFLDTDNYRRYDILADFIADMDQKNFLVAYQQAQPLLEEAFTELGYKDIKFTDRLEQTFQEILMAPVIKKPIVLIKDNQRYKFADTNLEKLSATQKLMIRMGPNNTVKIQNRVREIITQINNNP